MERDEYRMYQHFVFPVTKIFLHLLYKLIPDDKNFKLNSISKNVNHEASRLHPRSILESNMKKSFLIEMGFPLIPNSPTDRPRLQTAYRFTNFYPFLSMSKVIGAQSQSWIGHQSNEGFAITGISCQVVGLFYNLV